MSQRVYGSVWDPSPNRRVYAVWYQKRNKLTFRLNGTGTDMFLIQVKEGSGHMLKHGGSTWFINIFVI